MRKPFGSVSRRSTAALLIAGAGTITLDHRISAAMGRSSEDALAGDWRAVGGDLRRAMRGAGRVRYVA